MFEMEEYFLDLTVVEEGVVDGIMGCCCQEHDVEGC